MVSNEAMAAFGLFDEVPECMIETLLIVHGSGDRNSSEFTQVCERWTCILAPWIRALRQKEFPWGIKQARWNGKLHCWHARGLLNKSVYRNGKRDGMWWQWDINGQLCERGVHCNGKRMGVWQGWDDRGRLRRKGMYCDDKMEGEWHYWWNGKMTEKSMYRDGKREGECQVWQKYNGIVYAKGMYAKDKREGAWVIGFARGLLVFDQTVMYHNGMRV